MTKYFLGVDVGGTKTQTLIADETGQTLGLGRSGPGNHEVVGYDGLAAALISALDEALAMAGLCKEQITAAGFGIGGYDWPAERIETQRAIETLALPGPFEFVNDTIIGLIAGAAEGWGVAVVSGTGSNCWGRDRQGHEGRVTGDGSRFAEFGGASQLVSRAIQAISLDWSNRGPATQLTAAFAELVGASSAFDLLEGMVLGRYNISSSAAPLIFKVAQEGDAAAQELILWSGRELGSLATGVIRQLGFEPLEFEVVLIGSLFNGSPKLKETLSNTIHAVAPQARLVRLSAPPVVGGVLLGMEQLGLDYSHIRPVLIESTNALLAGGQKRKVAGTQKRSR